MKELGYIQFNIYKKQNYKKITLKYLLEPGDCLFIHTEQRNEYN